MGYEIQLHPPQVNLIRLYIFEIEEKEDLKNNYIQVCTRKSCNWTKCLKNPSCDVIKIGDYLSLFEGVFFSTSPLISFIFMTSHG